MSSPHLTLRRIRFCVSARKISMLNLANAYTNSLSSRIIDQTATVEEVVSGPSLQLLLVTPNVLCECFLQISFLHTSQHCFNNHVPPFFLDCYILHRRY